MNALRTPMGSPDDKDGEDRAPPRQDEECVELALLVPAWQCAALERAANSQGLTIGQLLRQLIVRRHGLGRVVPIRSAFTFQSTEEFEARARDAALGLIPELAGKAFHVRMHRHGFKSRLSSQEEERLLGRVLLEALEKAGTPGRITFEDPDVLLAVEPLGNGAGLSLWTRADLQRYPFLPLN